MFSQEEQKNKIIHQKILNKGQQQIQNSYRILQKLGKGGFAKVYLAEDIQNGEKYAIKVIDKSSIKKESFKEKLKQEIKFQSSLNHQNVVKYYNSFEDQHNVYIVLEYCSNQTFKQLMERRNKLTEIEVKSHLIQIINSLKYIHSQGIIHRDLKIENIFLNDKMVAKIADFGLSGKIISSFHKRKTICGTPNYIAPEVLKNVGHNYLVDNWAVGIIAYTFLIGTPPFEEKEVENTLSNVKAGRYQIPVKINNKILEKLYQNIKDNINISKQAQNFIQKILVQTPENRLSLDEMLQHEFLKNGEFTIPKVLPESTLTEVPSQNYLQKLRNYSFFDQKQQQNENNIYIKNKIEMNYQSLKMLTKVNQQLNQNLYQNNSSAKSVKQQSLSLLKKNHTFHDTDQLLHNTQKNENNNIQIIDNSFIYLQDYVFCDNKQGLGYLLNNGNLGFVLNDGNVFYISNKQINILKQKILLQFFFILVNFIIFKILIICLLISNMILIIFLKIFKIFLNKFYLFRNIFQINIKTQMQNKIQNKCIYYTTYIIKKESKYQIY
ncbi:polo, putative [Ichthyophthirius multifiliis]|uniref:Polo, putative n=1 Tax=Ichthyophthirius multifiliis TaxID=5932 RepID=G0QWP8_ICHMU|nr:polo, putative [Ichthyophthirius multifiliis]EGR30363.1 polo, putative [Ichthyophthirius multifiliis]|eukprot:XP_004031950.1 polo, putative [Ichthyophthirius multifiliis]